jgi:hypothetical protein
MPTETDATNEKDQGQIEIDYMKEDPVSAYNSLNKIIDELDNNPEENETILNNAYDIKKYYEENNTFLTEQFKWIKSFLFPEEQSALPEFVPNEPLEPIDDPEDEKRREAAIAAIKAKQKLRDEEAPGATPIPDNIVLPSAAEEIETLSESGKVSLEGGEISPPDEIIAPDSSPSGEELIDEKIE